MDADLRQERFHRAIAGLLIQERRLAAPVERHGSGVSEPPEVVALFQWLRGQAETQVEALTAYLTQTGGDLPTGAVAATPGEDTGSDTSLEASVVLRDVFVLVNELAIGYTALFAMAMRLFEPPLRELAPRHLRTHTEAAQAITAMLPQVVAAELAREGLICMCACPMCCIGVCGCVAGATGHVTAQWRETAPQAEAAPGYPLQAPRPGSQLAALGIPGGARLLSVDGEEVGSSPADAQAVIRRHPHDEEIHLCIRIGEDEPRDIVVTRADREGA